MKRPREGGRRAFKRFRKQLCLQHGHACKSPPVFFPCLLDAMARPSEGSVPVHWLSNVPFNPSSHVNHGRFSACWLSYEMPREHGAATRLQDDRGNKDSVVVNSTFQRALNIFDVLPAATRRSTAQHHYVMSLFFWCFER